MPKILAIDDSKTMRLAIKITFQAEDGEVVAVSKGSEAVARAKKQGSDIVLVDAVLADGEPSGYDVCRALKADSATAKTPVVIMVSNQVGIDNAAIEACGADGAITKPFDTSELIAKVAGLTGGVVKPVTRTTPRPAPAKPAAKPVAAKPAAKPAAAKPAPRPVAAKPAARPAATPRPAAKPVAKPSPRPRVSPVAPRPAASKPAASGGIPIVMPIPFAPAHAPTAGILKRLSEGKSVEGIDPKAAAALVSLSREVIEQVVWEVVPDLAEQIIRERQAN